jgi:tetratricopeptide (TPR) repeat protein
MFQDGKNLVRAGKWADARAKFSAVLEQQPDFAEGAVKTYLTACEKEVPNQKHFDEAAAALEHGEVGPAQRALSAVSADTQQINRRDELQSKLQGVFKQRVIDARDLASSPGDVAKMKKLQKLAEDLLLVRPEDRDALEYKALADRSLRPHGPEHVELPHDDPGLEVQKLFAQGDATGALKAAHECAGAADSCRVLGGKIEEFNGLLQRVEALQAGELDTALRLERAISGIKATPQGKPIHTRLAAVYYPKASAARAKADWPAAMEHALKVVDADPGHAGGSAIVAEGREKAHDLYLRCYTQRASNADEAAPLCAEAVRMLPPGDSTREKAERVLEAMRAK